MRNAIKVMAVLLVIGPGCGDDDDDGAVDATVSADAPATADAPTGADAPPAADAPVGAVVVVDCGSVTSDEQVDMENIAYSPASLTINAGDVVEWVNLDQVPHTVTSGNPGDGDAGAVFDSGNLGNGASYCLRFDEAGAYEYFCEVHPVQMADGLVTVN